MALDYLGDIAAKIRSLDLEMNRKAEIPNFKLVIQDANVNGLAQLLAAHQTIQSYITAASREDGMLVVSAFLADIS